MIYECPICGKPEDIIVNLCIHYYEYHDNFELNKNVQTWPDEAETLRDAMRSKDWPQNFLDSYALHLIERTGT